LGDLHCVSPRRKLLLLTTVPRRLSDNKINANAAARTMREEHSFFFPKLTTIKVWSVHSPYHRANAAQAGPNVARLAKFVRRTIEENHHATGVWYLSSCSHWLPESELPRRK
jgi:hypothetical protein